MFIRESSLINQVLWVDGLPIPGHNHFDDHLAGGVNALVCDCGQQLLPDCDMSARSINDCFNAHRLGKLLERVRI